MKPDPAAGPGPPASAPPVWEVPPPDPESEFDVCRKRAEAARMLAGKTEDPIARGALEVVAANWEHLGDHLAVRPRRRRRAPASLRKAALGIEP